MSPGIAGGRNCCGAASSYNGRMSCTPSSSYDVWLCEQRVRQPVHGFHGSVRRHLCKFYVVFLT
jgi:hypothetical protein